LAALEIGAEAPSHALEHRFVDRPVDVAPPDVGFARRLLDDVLVFGRSPGKSAGARDKGAASADQTLAATDGILVQDRHRQIPMGGGDIAHPLLVEPIAAGRSGYGVSCVLHGIPSWIARRLVFFSRSLHGRPAASIALGKSADNASLARFVPVRV